MHRTELVWSIIRRLQFNSPYRFMQLCVVELETLLTQNGTVIDVIISIQPLYTKTNGISVNIFFCVALTFRFARLLMLHPLFHTFYVFLSLFFFFVYFVNFGCISARPNLCQNILVITLHFWKLKSFLKFVFYKSSGSFDATTE